MHIHFPLRYDSAPLFNKRKKERERKGREISPEVCGWAGGRFTEAARNNQGRKELKAVLGHERKAP